jgi:hypothetical protein
MRSQRCCSTERENARAQPGQRFVAPILSNACLHRLLLKKGCSDASRNINTDHPPSIRASNPRGPYACRVEIAVPQPIGTRGRRRWGESSVPALPRVAGTCPG